MRNVVYATKTDTNEGKMFTLTEKEYQEAKEVWTVGGMYECLRLKSLLPPFFKYAEFNKELSEDNFLMLPSMEEPSEWSKATIRQYETIDGKKVEVVSVQNKYGWKRITDPTEIAFIKKNVVTKEDYLNNWEQRQNASNQLLLAPVSKVAYQAEIRGLSVPAYEARLLQEKEAREKVSKEWEEKEIKVQKERHMIIEAYKQRATAWKESHGYNERFPEPWPSFSNI